MGQTEQKHFFGSHWMQDQNQGFEIKPTGFLSASAIRQLITDHSLISPADPDQLKYMEGSAYDLRVAKVFEYPTPHGDPRGVVPFIGKTVRRTPVVKEIVPTDCMVKIDGKLVEFEGWHLEGVDSYILQTMETITLPPDIIALTDSRTSIFRCNALLFATPVRPGYSGTLEFLLHVPNLDGLYLEKGARVASLVFGQLGPGNTDPYRGVWNRDRVSTDGKGERGF